MTSPPDPRTLARARRAIAAARKAGPDVTDARLAFVALDAVANEEDLAALALWASLPAPKVAARKPTRKPARKRR